MQGTDRSASLQKTLYKDAVGYLLTLGGLNVTVLRRGGKLQSIRWDGREWLWQRQGTHFRFAAYGARFETGEFSGFDDMFPTISACPYPQADFSEVTLPDHGEVWTQDFDCREEGSQLWCGVKGVALPYRFSKGVSLEENSIVIQYQVENLSDKTLCYLWAAHPLFVLQDGMRVEIPGAETIFNAAMDQDNLGAFGQIHPWPVCASGRDMRRLSGQHHTFQKYYVWNSLSQNQVLLHYPDGTTLTMEATVAQAPYLGMWVDECGYGGYHMRCVAPEPCTAALDRLDFAAAYDKQSLLPPLGTASWQLRIDFAKE